MIEVLWHGRGGQGAFTASRLLGAAWCVDANHHALAFPSFGPERRGAPMCAYTKLSDGPIGDRSAVSRADFAVYLDETLLGANWDTELADAGRVLINSRETFDDSRIIAIDADGISTEVLGRAIPNTALLAALGVLIDGLRRDDLVRAIEGYMPARLQKKNVAVIDAVLDVFDKGGTR